MDALRGRKTLSIGRIYQCPRSGTKYTHPEAFDQLNSLFPARTKRQLPEGIVDHIVCRVTVSARVIGAELLPKTSAADDNQYSEATKRKPRQPFLRA